MQTSKCHSPIGDSKEEWKIFRALSDYFDKALKFNNLQQLRDKLLITHPLFSKLFSKPSINKITFGSNYNIKEREIEYNIKNFYMTDSISRSSETMANCIKQITNKVA